MADVITIQDARALGEATDRAAVSPGGEVLRDIARGGVSGVLVGIVVGGIGGRVVMRLAALLHPDAVGAMTENGNRIGEITMGGTLALVLFGMILCAIAGAIWVIVSPWIPGRTAVRALLTAGIAVALGLPQLIIGGNPDFVILDHDPLVVALLVALVGLVGLSISIVDTWLDRRLPHPSPGRRGPAVLYAAVTLMGAAMVLPFVLLVFLTADEYRLPLRAGHALLVVGGCTAAWWVLRLRGRIRAPRGLELVARGALLVAVVLGVLTSLPHLSRALGAAS